MTTKAIRNNISILRSVRDRNVGRVSPSIQQKINTIVDLYEDRKYITVWHCRASYKKHRNYK